MKTTDIRTKFLEYFQNRNHQLVESSSLIPANDPTLLFTNAGMVPFKDLFLAREKRNYVRAASSQRCVRAGGKHNDLENVGYTARHHTFFEMLGNFSFGDYFKKEAIHFAWEFLTQELNLPAEKLWITVFEEDDETADIWLKDIGVDSERFSRIGAKDNFWSMGDTGPCGPCTEIFFDHGEDVAGGPPGTPEEDGDRYVEIWNLVFMQYDRKSSGELVDLPKPSVDTGMGLERLAAVMQKVHSNYDTDLFQGLIRAAAKATCASDMSSNSLKVIADHIRSCSFLILDGVVPSNEGCGYVLRRIIRRAARHGFELGQKNSFFHTLVDALCEQMGEAYPDLVAKKDFIAQVLKQEEERFAETLEHGMKILDDAIASLNEKTIPGETVFKLYDTYGFPADLTADIALNKGLNIDQAGFEKAMTEQRERARGASAFSVDYGDAVNVDRATEFSGYSTLEDQSEVVQLVKDGQIVESLSTGEEGIIVLDKTPFYAESGGQAGDSGTLSNNSVSITVIDTQKQAGSVFLHQVKIKSGHVAVGMSLQAKVADSDRVDIECNHSATHLLHAVLRKLLGDHVSQKGSLVEADRLRFDFSHPTALAADEIVEIESMVNQQIRANLSIDAKVMSMDDAKKTGAMALFDEKYGDEVRVLQMGDFSIELCGGTHVSRTGEIGMLKIVGESGVAAGVRRIEAVTGRGAVAHIQYMDRNISALSALLNSKSEAIVEKVSQLQEKSRSLEKELEKLKSKLSSSAGSDLAGNAVDVDGVKVVAAHLEGADVKALRETVDQLKNKLGTSAVILAAVEDEKVRLVAGVSKDAVSRVKAGELVNAVAQQIGGKGGGRPDMAQAGGTQPEKLNEALSSVPEWIKNNIK